METFQDINFLSPWEPGILTLLIFAFMSLILVTVLLLLSNWIGKKKPNPEKLRPYECGIIPTGPV